MKVKDALKILLGIIIVMLFIGLLIRDNKFNKEHPCKRSHHLYRGYPPADVEVCDER